MQRADDLLHYAKTRDQWERRSCGDGAKGEQLYDWTAFAVKVKDENPADGDAHWLVLRRRGDHRLTLACARRPRVTEATVEPVRLTPACAGEDDKS
ncbi:hypothetical protein [Streptomyces mirabilis]|uniref:hypothetical protein n=1 Tax=Streptomyces mirabilis TaxID=68239 RepID=UPI0036A511CE